ncbi:hypothetical protein K4T85_12010 [Staphylococcus epidermidis]|nr:hypothetical protein [Staphylococcus epidermidis]
MVKIKNKVTLKPKELIKYLLDFEETEFALYIETEGGYNNLFKPKLKVENYITYNEEEETFTIEVEEEITEDTVFKRIYEHTKLNHFLKHENVPISKIKGDLSEEFWIKDGNTMILIWKDGKIID